MAQSSEVFGTEHEVLSSDYQRPDESLEWKHTSIAQEVERQTGGTLGGKIDSGK